MAKVVGGITSIAGGCLSIFAILAAPATGGLSLAMAGFGTGILGGAVNIVAEGIKDSKSSNYENELNKTFSEIIEADSKFN